MKNKLLYKDYLVHVSWRKIKLNWFICSEKLLPIGLLNHPAFFQEWKLIVLFSECINPNLCQPDCIQNPLPNPCLTHPTLLRLLLCILIASCFTIVLGNRNHVRKHTIIADWSIVLYVPDLHKPGYHGFLESIQG